MKSKKIFLAAALLATFGSASALNLKTEADKVGYAVGTEMGQSVKELGEDNININAVILGLKDAYEGADLAIDAKERDAIMQKFAESRMKELQEQYEKELAANTEAGKKFLEENGKKEGVQTTASGLQYRVDKQGEGAKPTEQDRVTVNYEGKLIDGKVFDSSYERKEPVTFAVTDVIPGWVEGLQLMNVGSTYTFYIPSDLAYGEAGAGPAIPPNSTLIFKVELLKIEAPQEKQSAAGAEDKSEERVADKTEDKSKETAAENTENQSEETATDKTEEKK